MKQILLILFSLILVTIGVVFIYDARIITNKLLNARKQNKGSFIFKIIGIILSIIGVLIIYFSVKYLK